MWVYLCSVVVVGEDALSMSWLSGSLTTNFGRQRYPRICVTRGVSAGLRLQYTCDRCCVSGTRPRRANETDPGFSIRHHYEMDTRGLIQTWWPKLSRRKGAKSYTPRCPLPLSQVVPGTPTMQSMQSPYGAYWPSGDYSGMSTGVRRETRVTQLAGAIGLVDTILLALLMISTERSMMISSLSSRRQPMTGWLLS